MPFDHLNRLFIPSKLVAFRFGREAENDFNSKCHSTTWIIALSTSSKSHFGLVKRQNKCSQCQEITRKFVFWIQPSRILGWSRGRKWVESVMRTLETSLFRPHPNRILGWSRGWKWVRSAWRQLETSLYQPHVSRILGLPRGRKRIKMPWKHLKRSFNDFIQVEFLGLWRERKWL